MPRPVLTFAAILCLAIGLAACGDDDGSDTTVTETETVSSSTDETTATEATEETTTTEPTGGVTPETPPPAEEGTEGPAFFATPSGNIGCSVGKGGARCDIRKRSWKPTPPTRPCELDYGGGIAVGKSGAEFICAGDTALGAPAVLEYGERAQRRAFFCDSTEEGVTCSNLHTGAGFFISRDSYRIF